jgi:uncharacterized protein YndB with AHSA1/START domain
MTTNKPVGQTASVGFQIGVRRTLPLSQEQAWTLLTSREGLRLWLGELEELPTAPRTPYMTQEGTAGELRVIKPKEQLRLTWQPQRWSTPSSLQIRLLPAAEGKTTISFHQEKLIDAEVRESMKQRWEDVLSKLTYLSTGEPT